MKIALICAPVKNGKTDFNLRAMMDEMKNYSGRADLIVFGESMLQGFDCLSWDYESDKSIAVTLTDEPVRQMREAARENSVAVSFGFIERVGDELYSSQIFIGSDGDIINLFHRVSIGWKEQNKTDCHYREGERFEKFSYGGKSFSVGLCGDLWTEGRPEEIRALNADIVLWPVWCDYGAEEWNSGVKREYAEQAALCGNNVLLVNPFCADDIPDRAEGGCVWFQKGFIRRESPAGRAGGIIAEIE